MGWEEREVGVRKGGEKEGGKRMGGERAVIGEMSVVG